MSTSSVRHARRHLVSAHLVSAHLISACLLVVLATTTTRADEIALVGGDVLTGTIIETTDEAVILDHPALGRIEVPRANVQTLDGEPLPPVPPAPPPAPPRVWKSRFDLGFNGSWGNTNTQTIHIGLTSQRRTPRDRTDFDAHWYYDRDDNDTSENQFTTGVLHDWLIPESRWLYWGDVRYDHDQFQSWSNRVASHLGVGYQLIDEENLDFTLRGGFGGNREWGSMNDDITWEAVVGFTLEWTMTDKQSLQAGSKLYPDLSETGEFRALTTAAWAYRLSDQMNMSLIAGLRHEYQSITDPGDDKNDLKLTVGLGFDF